MPLATKASLKALADPMRLRVGLLLIDEAHTVKELATSLGVPPTRLYYHVRILEEQGLIEVVGRRMVSGIEERRYQAVLDAWDVGDDLQSSALADSGVIGALFGAVQAEMQVVLQGQPDTAIGDPKSEVAVLTLAELALTPAELADLQTRLQGIIQEFAIDRVPVPDGAQRYHLLLAGYRRPHAS